MSDERIWGNPVDNPSSWQQVLELIDDYPENETWAVIKRDMKSIMNAGASADLNHAFRAGMSMHHILFSTLNHHGLRDELHVTLGKTDDGSRFFIGYSQSNLWFTPPIAIETCATPDEACTILRNFLVRLWKDTRAHEPLPIGLGNTNG